MKREIQKLVDIKIKVYPPCPEGKIRYPITHRCRKQNK